MLEFRPHHFLCALGYAGKGYSADFVRNFDAIAARLLGQDGDLVPIRVVEQTDSICTPCPSKRGTRCETQAKIEGLDQAHAEIMDWNPGETVTWGEAKERIASHMTIGKFNEACAPCSWKKLGICEQRLNQLHVEVRGKK